MAITANVKDGKLFTLGVVAALVLAFLTLLYKDALSAFTARRVAGEPKRKAAGSAAWDTATEPGWIGPTVFALGGAYGTLYALWAGNPSWGEDGFAAIAALIGAALAAVGAKTIFSPGTGQPVTGDGNRLDREGSKEVTKEAAARTGHEDPAQARAAVVDPGTSVAKEEPGPRPAKDE